MAFPLIPVALASGVGLLLLLSSKKSSAAPSGPVGPVKPSNIPNTPGRPKGPPGNAPVGSGSATVIPDCTGLTGQAAAACNAGLLVHSSPNTDPSTLISPQDASPTSRHALRGDVVAVITQNVADQSNPPTTRVWWEIMTPVGSRGYVSAIGTAGKSNFTAITDPTAGGGGGGEVPIQTFAGVGARLPRRMARCTSPTGCYLRSQPAGQRGQAIVPAGASVAFHGTRQGWAHVTYSNGRQTMTGWIPADTIR